MNNIIDTFDSTLQGFSITDITNYKNDTRVVQKSLRHLPLLHFIPRKNH